MLQLSARLMRFARIVAAGANRGVLVAARSRDRAQDLVEYGVAVAVVAVTVLGAIQLFGGGISAFFTRLLTHFSGLA
jgi:Flp pilus assembly pilin Flp